MDNYIGKRLDGRYEITELIGQGGMANVYKATDVLDNRIVAVKILKREFSESDEFLRRFRNESKAIAVLSHPNIVKIYDMGFSEKLQYIVMEYIDGITLKEYIDSERVLNWKDAVHFIIQILSADGGCLRHLRRLERRAVRRRGGLPPGLSGRGPAVLHQYCGQVRRTGPGGAEKGRGTGHSDAAAPARLRVAAGPGVHPGQIRPVEPV